MTRINKLVAGSGQFISTGVSRIKKSTRDEEDGNGRVEFIEVPIRSISVSEALEIAGDGPTPPGIKMLQGTEWVMATDFTDKAYLKRKMAHDKDVGFAMISLGVDIPFTDEDGKEITDTRHRIACMRSQGFSQFHFEKLLGDIQSLTKESESETTDFFSNNSGAQEKN